MQTVSRQFLAQTYTSGRVISSADIYLGDALLLEDAPVTEASVTMDLDSDIIRSANITLIDLDNSGSGRASGGPALLGNIDAFRVEISLKCGYVLPDGSEEMVSLGRFMIWSIEQSLAEGETLHLELYDRTKYLDMFNLVKPYDASNVYAKDAIQKLVDDAMPFPTSVTFDTQLQTVLLPPGTSYDANALDAIVAIADTMGGQFSFDANGNAVVKPQPTILPEDTIDKARFTVTCGPTGNVIQLSSGLSRDSVYNGVAVYGGAIEGKPQPYGEAFDFLPGSKTFWGGTFGRRILKLQRPELLTSLQCYVAAAAKLTELTSAVNPITITMLPNPALEPGDAIKVVWPDLIREELHMIRNIDFDYGEMTMTIKTSGTGGEFV